MGKLAGEKKEAFAVATAMEEAADALRERRIKSYSAGRMSVDDYEDAILRELELRGCAARIVAENLGAIISMAQEAEANIEQAIVDAKAKIASVQSTRRALEIVVAIIALAGSIYAGNVGAIVAASGQLASVTKTSNQSAKKAVKPQARKPARTHTA